MTPIHLPYADVVAEQLREAIKPRYLEIYHEPQA